MTSDSCKARICRFVQCYRPFLLVLLRQSMLFSDSTRCMVSKKISQIRAENRTKLRNVASASSRFLIDGPWTPYYGNSYVCGSSFHTFDADCEVWSQIGLSRSNRPIANSIIFS